MRGWGFLGRVAGAPRAGDELEEVVGHLHALLNTRLGSAAIDPSYGVIDPASAAQGPGTASRRFRDSVLKAIDRFEPRMKQVTISDRPAPRGARMGFEIRAAIETRRGRRVVQLSTAVRDDGAVDIVEVAP